jgi:hypothetical protein
MTVETGESGPRNPVTFVQIAVRVLVSAVLLIAIAYAGDTAAFQYRVSVNRQPYGSVTVQHYDSIGHKDGRAELIFDPPVQKTCVNSFFPHRGNPPCWYLSRHSEQVTNL